jgi:hypothetical protein
MLKETKCSEGAFLIVLIGSGTTSATISSIVQPYKSSKGKINETR